MTKKIIPSIIAKNQKEVDERIKKVGKYTRVFHLDVMDGKFVKAKSLDFDFTIPDKFSYGVHLMVKNPLKWVEKNAKSSKMIIFHYESCKNEGEILELIDLIRKKGKKVGIAINPKTSIVKVRDFANKIDLILIMAVNPGKYGAKFIPGCLDKAKSIKRHYPKLLIEIDGGINNKTIAKAGKSGANQFIVGSYLQNSEDVGESLNELARFV